MYPKRVDSTILRALTGSRAYDTATEDSDYDWIRAHIRDKAYYLGIKSEVRPDAIQEGDTTDHEIRHFIGMCCKFNPNIIVALWSPNVVVSRGWEWLTEQRHLFNSKKAITTFLGFATGQIKQAGKPNTTGRFGVKRKALIDKHGAPGTKNARGKTYGISGHLWSALAIADFVSNGVIVPGVKPGNIQAEPVEAGLFPS